jgi:hypothetical protein
MRLLLEMKLSRINICRASTFVAHRHLSRIDICCWKWNCRASSVRTTSDVFYNKHCFLICDSFTILGLDAFCVNWYFFIGVTTFFFEDGWIRFKIEFRSSYSSKVCSICEAHIFQVSLNWSCVSNRPFECWGQTPKGKISPTGRTWSLGVNIVCSLFHSTKQ